VAAFEAVAGAEVWVVADTESVVGQVEDPRRVELRMVVLDHLVRHIPSAALRMVLASMARNQCTADPADRISVATTSADRGTPDLVVTL
jgi:hypothetical protein